MISNSKLSGKKQQVNLSSNFSTDVAKLYGREAFEAQINLSYSENEPIWLKMGNNIFFTGEVPENGVWGLWGTREKDTDRRKTEFYEDGFEFLADLAYERDGGVLYLPGKPDKYPLKEYCTESNDIGGEMDDGDEASQRHRIEAFAIHSGVIPNFIVSSGGKSLHPHLILDEAIEIEHRNYFSKLLVIALLGDPAVARTVQPMRMAGFHRKDKGRDKGEQYLQVFNEIRYSVEELEQGFQQFFEYQNYKFPTLEELQDERWGEITKTLKKAITRAEKEIEIRHLLVVAEELLPENIRKRKSEVNKKVRAERKEKDAALGIVTDNGVFEAAKDWKRKLGSDAFDWPDSDWQWAGNKARGCCPFHPRTSGNSAWIEETEAGDWLFHCPSCGIAAGAVWYQWKLEHGGDAPHPKGEEWANFVKKLTGYVDSPYWVAIAKAKVKAKAKAEAIAKAEVVEVTESIAETVEATEVAETKEAKEITEVTEVAKNTEVTETLEVTESVVEIAEATVEVTEVTVEDAEATEEEKAQALESHRKALERYRQEYENRRRDRAAYKFTRKADVVAETGYLPTFPLAEIKTSLIGIKGDWGIGKSHLISHWCKEWKDKIIQVGHLNALLANTAPKFELIHHKVLKANANGDDSLYGLHGYYAERLAITDISLGALLEVEKWAYSDPFILVLDEIEQVLKSLQLNKNLLSTDGQSRQLRLQARLKLEWLIRNATYVIGSDRDLSDDTLNYVEKIRGGDKFYLIHHTGVKGDGRTVKINRNKFKDELLSQMVRDIQAGLKIIIPCENKSDLLAIELLLQAAGIEDKAMFFAHGDNSNEAGIKEIIASIDKAYTQYQIFGYTMTCGTAISLEEKHFDKCYAFFTGDVLSASEQAQMLFRYRQICELNVWCSPVRKTLEIDPDNMMLNLVSRNQETDALIAKSLSAFGGLIDAGVLPQASGVIGDEEIPWLDHKLRLKAQGNASRANPLQSLCDVLEGAGFILEITCTDDEGTSGDRTIRGEEHKEFKKEIRDANDKAIANAETLDELAYQSALMNSGSATKEVRNKIAKTKLVRELGIEVTEEIVKLERSKKLTRGVKMLRILLGDEATAVANDLDDRAKRQDKADQAHYARKREILIELGIIDLISKLETKLESAELESADYSYTNTSNEIISLAHKIRDKRKDVKRYFDLHISTEMKDGLQNDDVAKVLGTGYKWSNTKVVASLLDYLCIPRESKQFRNTEGNQIWTYKLDRDKWALIKEAIAHQSGGLKTPKIEGIIRKLKSPEASAEVLATQSVNPVTHPSDYCIKTSLVCDSLPGGLKPQSAVPPYPEHLSLTIPDLSSYFKDFYSLDNLAERNWNQATLAEKIRACKALGCAKPLIDGHFENPSTVTRAEIILRANGNFKEDLEHDSKYWASFYKVSELELGEIISKIPSKPKLELAIASNSNETFVEF